MIKRVNLRLAIVVMLLSIPLCCSRVDATIVAGNALQFDGSADFAKIADATHLRFDSSQSLTIELWFNPSATNVDQQVLLEKRKYTTANGPYYIMRLDYDYVWGGFRDTGGTKGHAGSTTSISANQWCHIALVRNASTNQMRFFVNGQLESTQSDSTSDILPTLDLTLGKSRFTHPHHFAGLMDEVRIWNIALDDAYIGENYNRIIQNPGITSNLVGYWNFDEDFSNQNIFDLSSYGHNGMLGNSLSIGSDDPLRVVSTAPIVHLLHGL